MTASLTRRVMFCARSVPNLLMAPKITDRIFVRLLMDLLLFHSQDRNPKTLKAEFTLEMTVSGLI